MYRLKRKAKDHRTLPIPDELRESLRVVSELIRESRHDPHVHLDYDDAIQVGPVCGGRVGRRPRSYVLNYDPEDDPDRGCWFLTLHRNEIEAIGDGRITEIAMYCCTSPDCRFKFREAYQTCYCCDYVDRKGRRPSR